MQQPPHQQQAADDRHEHAEHNPHGPKNKRPLQVQPTGVIGLVTRDGFVADSTARYGSCYIIGVRALSRLAQRKHGIASSCAITEKAIRAPIDRE